MKIPVLVTFLFCLLLPFPVLAEGTFELHIGRVDTESGRFTHIDSGGTTFYHRQFYREYGLWRPGQQLVGNLAQRRYCLDFSYLDIYSNHVNFGVSF